LEYFLIVEKIDEEKASLYIWHSGAWPPVITLGWKRYEAKVSKERGKYTLWYSGPFGNTEYTLKGKYLNSSDRNGDYNLRRVP
jgi:hypothetical protein